MREYGFSNQGIYCNPSLINFLGKFPTQTNFLKQYTYSDFFEISEKERSVCIVFCFVGSCQEATLLPIIDLISHN